jgi:hypothetical protein
MSEKTQKPVARTTPVKPRVKKVQVFDQDAGAVPEGPAPKRVHKDGVLGQSRSGPVHDASVVEGVDDVVGRPV